MKKQNEKYLAYAVAFLLMTALLFSHIRHETLTLRIDGSHFIFAGMMERDDNGNKIYVPIYKRTN